MKTSKAREISKPKKASETGESIRRKKVTSSKSVPSEEEIRKKAYEIYNQRIERGRFGTPSDDWHEAEKLLRES